MPVVRVVKSWSSPDLLRQSPGGSGVWGDLRVTLDPVETPDYVVAFNHIPETLRVTVSPDNVWCFIQEPPEPEYRWMRKGFPHFARIYTQDPGRRGPRYLHDHGSLPWHVGRSYDELVNESLPHKSRPLAWVTSNLALHPGHRRRLAFLERLRAEMHFDLYGRGFTPIPDKWDALAPARYAIAVENRSIPHYWTEKIADAFLAGAMPLYFGATNIDRWFPRESYVWLDIDDPATPRRVAEIVNSDLAEKNRDALFEARRRVLDEYQFFPRLASLIAAHRATEPARLLTLPGVPDATHYYRKTPALTRTWRSLVRRFAA